MTREHQAEHDELTKRYYREGNPDRLSAGEFISLHDEIWLDFDQERGALTLDEVTDRQYDIARRSAEADGVRPYQE